MSVPVLVAVAWPYVNGDLHVGHLAGYLVPADICARFHRLIGNKVLMVSGSDCYGTPITLEADKRGVLPEEIVEEYHAKNLALFAQYGLSYDLYTKTATANHQQVVQDMFVRLLNNGYIFKDVSLQYYDQGAERFLPDRYVEGTCPHCGYTQARSDQCDRCGSVLEQGELKDARSKQGGGAVVLKETEHYFLDWPKLQPFLTSYVQKVSPMWKDWVQHETNQWISRGLKPRAITRDLDWGVEIPVDQIPESMRIDGASHKRLYVWFDAVIGYLSASIEWADGSDAWKEWWENPDALQVYFMGKDNLVFHTLFWPGQLYGAFGDAIHLPDYPAINQFLTLEGQKFSKSRGITIDSKYLADTYTPDAIRFYLCSILPEQADASFSWDDFVTKHNSLLIGNLGNFIHRTLTLLAKADRTVAKVDPEVQAQVLAILAQAREHFASYQYKAAWEDLLALSSLGNGYLNSVEPWRHAGEQQANDCLETCLLIVIALSVIMQMITPQAGQHLVTLLGIHLDQWDEDPSSLLALVKAATPGKPTPLFTKLDPSVVATEVAKLPALS